ncbi:hypothetical protein C0584_04875 [Candidatus Parcubacteria bacterium]|nr:MAG: hypothetical protein C0584_04875 [Candidatus Parcubacteria bacterium]
MGKKQSKEKRDLELMKRNFLDLQSLRNKEKALLALEQNSELEVILKVVSVKIKKREKTLISLSLKKN